jgi:hypothetical protein
MKSFINVAATTTALAAALWATTASARPVAFTQHFPGGFDVSINGGPLVPSGPITVTGVLDDATADILPDLSFGEFPLTSVTFNGAGFVNRSVVTPLSLLTFSFSDLHFGFQRLSEFNEGIIGWNGTTPSGPFMSDRNDLSTLVPLPYSTVGTSTFWYDGLGSNVWTLDLGGDTIGADLGVGGPDGIFTITAIPEPSTVALTLLGIMSMCFGNRRRGQSRT